MKKALALFLASTLIIASVPYLMITPSASSLAITPLSEPVVNASAGDYVSQTIRIHPGDDTQLNESYPDTPGIYSTYRIGIRSWDASVGDVENYRNIRSLLKFNLSGIPEGAVILDAELRLYCYYTGYTIPGVTDVQVRPARDDWTEDTATWNDPPWHGEPLDVWQAPAIMFPNAWVSWMITDFVENEFETDKTVSLMLRAETESHDNQWRNVYFRSKDYYKSDYHPYLRVTYVPPPSDVIYPSDDAELHEGYPDTPGSEIMTDRIGIRSWDASMGGVENYRNIRSLLKFDLSGIPEDVTIVDSKLWLYSYYAERTRAEVTDVQVRAVGDDQWTEGAVTWNAQPPYGDVLDVWVPPELGDNCAYPNVWVSWEVTEFLESELGADETVSLMLRAETESYDDQQRGVYFRSKEAAENRPYLEVTYVKNPTYTDNISVAILRSGWIAKPGDNFEVEVEVRNNENLTIENVSVYAYVYSDNEVLNVGGERSNEIYDNFLPFEIKTLILPITIKPDALPGLDNLKARAELLDSTYNQDTQLLQVENSGTHVRAWNNSNVFFNGSSFEVQVTVANLTADNMENAEFYAYVQGDNSAASVATTTFVDADFTDSGITLTDTIAENGDVKLAPTATWTLTTSTWVQTTAMDFESGGILENIGITDRGHMLLAPAENADAYRPAGVFTSAVHDAGWVERWGAITWDAATPTGTSVTIETRTGAVATPDNTWSDWQVCTSSENVPSTVARYIQYRAELATTDNKLSSVLYRVQIIYDKHVLLGTFQSQVIDLSENVLSFDWLWAAFNSGTTTPVGTSITFQTRTSPDSLSWSDWSTIMNQVEAQEYNLPEGWPVSLALEGDPVTSPENRYIQLLARLSTDNENLTPVLHAYNIAYVLPQDKRKVSLVAGGISTWVFELAIRMDAEPDNYELAAVLQRDGTTFRIAEDVYLTSLESLDLKIKSYLDVTDVSNVTSLAREIIRELQLPPESPIDVNEISRYAENLWKYKTTAERVAKLRAGLQGVIQYISERGSGITSEEALELVKYIQSSGALPTPLAEELRKRGFNGYDIELMTNWILEHSPDIADELPYLGLQQLKATSEQVMKNFVDLVAIGLHIKIAVELERQLSEPSVPPENYMSTLDNYWTQTRVKLDELGNNDNWLYENIKAGAWENALDVARVLASEAENYADELAAQIRFAMYARAYFRDNGTENDVRSVAEHEFSLTKALDRLIYYYQKGIYYQTIAKSALSGDPDLAADEVQLTQSMPFTVEIPDKEFVTVEQLLSDPDTYDNTSVWVKGFVSYLMEDEEDIYYSTFDLSTYEMDNVADIVSVYFPQGWLTTKGADEGSYAVIHGVFNAIGMEIESHEVKLWQGDVVAENTPICWELVEPWRKRVYMQRGFTRSWGYATYITENQKDTHEGFLRAALTRFSYVNLDVEDPGAMTVAVCASLHVDSALPGEYFNYYPILERFTDILGTWGACRTGQGLRDPDEVIVEPKQEGEVEWNGVYYNSRDEYYRSPVGEPFQSGNVDGDRVAGGEDVTFRIMVFHNDVTEVRLRVWNGYLGQEEIFGMKKVAVETVPILHFTSFWPLRVIIVYRDFEWWECTVPAPPEHVETEYWYHFEIIDGADNDMYADDSARRAGMGRMYEDISDAYDYLLGFSGDDDCDPREVGVWALDDLSQWWWGSGDLPNAVEAARRFHDELVSQGFTGKYKINHETNVEEEHFEKKSYGGEDYIYADACDFIYVRTHGDGAEFIVGTGLFPYSYDRVELYETVEWGDVDMEWAFISACEVLSQSNVTNAFGNGFHGIGGFHSTAYDVLNDGYYFARYATGQDYVPGLGWGPFSVGDSWKFASKKAQPWCEDENQVWAGNRRAKYILPGLIIDYWDENLPGYGEGMYSDPDYGAEGVFLSYTTWRCTWP